MIAQQHRQILGHAQELTLTVPVLITHVAEKLVSQTVPALAQQDKAVAKRQEHAVQLVHVYMVR
jgi:hypothetical protein